MNCSCGFFFREKAKFGGPQQDRKAKGYALTRCLKGELSTGLSLRNSTSSMKRTDKKDTAPGARSRLSVRGDRQGGRVETGPGRQCG